ncbi:low molecular weight phosphotyrosine protein phosphatase [Leptospira ryugenii]|uniref:Low molecular weight phosphotyrosine protein phosphatase n=1 Tax=Leptospira ryugenii TaxID=1917863 RepID=A0A2P2E4V4_9LEPT|nr:low molecular weight protein-tyrosine-phosphatase [Leptospira ryugenii]GBF51910.1 low molecular weight phosphotyrosine protein phosphatase [Leptospira ryugenii]
MNKIKILFVCLGNICRSPAAEASFTNLVKDCGLSNFFEIDSCGTSGYHDGELADPRTRLAAKKRNKEITHRSRKFLQRDLEIFDYILAMDKSNYAYLLKSVSSDTILNKIFLFRSFDKSDEYQEVPDPYYGTTKDFDEVQLIVEKASFCFLEFLKEKYPYLRQSI